MSATNGHAVEDGRQLAVLSVCAADPRWLDRLGAFLRADHFRGRNAAVYATMQRLRREGAPVDVTAIAADIDRNGDLTEHLGADWLHYLTSICEYPCTADPDYHARQIVAEAQRSRLRVRLDAARLAMDDPTRDAAEIVASLQTEAESPSGAKDRPCLRIDSITSEEFAAAKYDLRFLIKKVFVADQPLIVGGAQKSMKTGVALDAVFSLGTGTPFLGEFYVPEAVPVGFISAESGQYTLQEKAKEIASSRGRLLSTALVHWYFKPVQLGISQHVDALCAWITERKLKVLVVDPAYLCMSSDDTGQPINFANLFEVGVLLSRFTQRFLELGCTPVILHHESKGANSFRRRGDFSPPELSDLSMAGFAEWARQWILLARRETYEQGSGVHRLWANVGGSAGHGGLWAVNINEGQLQDDFTGRKWDVAVSTGTEARQSTEGDKEAAAKQKADEKAQKLADADRVKLQAVLESMPDGVTFTQLRRRTGIADDRLHTLLTAWEKNGSVEKCTISGVNKIKYDGYKPRKLPPEPAISGTGGTSCKPMALVPSQEG